MGILRTQRDVRRLHRFVGLERQELSMDHAPRHDSAGDDVVPMQFWIYRAAAGGVPGNHRHFSIASAPDCPAAVLRLRLGEWRRHADAAYEWSDRHLDRRQNVPGDGLQHRRRLAEAGAVLRQFRIWRNTMD